VQSFFGAEQMFADKSIPKSFFKDLSAVKSNNGSDNASANLLSDNSRSDLTDQSGAMNL